MNMTLKTALSSLIAGGGKNARTAQRSLMRDAVEYLSLQILMHGNGDAAKVFDDVGISKSIKGFALVARNTALSERASYKKAGELAKNGKLLETSQDKATSLAAALADTFIGAIVAKSEEASATAKARASARKTTAPALAANDEGTSDASTRVANIQSALDIAIAQRDSALAERDALAVELAALKSSIAKPAKKAVKKAA